MVQEKEVERIGRNDRISVDVRVLPATNRDVDDSIAAGSFRQDLLNRLNLFPIRIPLLRERIDDIAFDQAARYQLATHVNPTSDERFISSQSRLLLAACDLIYTRSAIGESQGWNKRRAAE